MMRPLILSAGGTGGHVFPALSLAAELKARGYPVIIMTDHRGDVFYHSTDVLKIIKLPLGRRWCRSNSFFMALGIGLSFLWALGHMIWLRPKAVIGFGGYSSVPAILAGQALGVPTALQEQNAVLGRANRLVAPFVKRLAISYQKVRFAERYQQKTVYTGTPARAEFMRVRKVPYCPPQAGQAFRLFIMGGSQGAKIFSDVIPQALSGLPSALRQRLVIYQQCRPEYIEATHALYQQARMAAHVQEFFTNVDHLLREAHLFIGRAGASTLAELTLSGRPALLVPYARAMDNHQHANALSLAEAGAAHVIAEREFTPERLQELMKEIMEDSRILKDMAYKMYSLGSPEAPVKLAHMVEDLLQP